MYIVATRDIAPGEEVTYDYRYESLSVTDRQRCACGAPSCSGWLGRVTAGAALVTQAAPVQAGVVVKVGGCAWASSAGQACCSLRVPPQSTLGPYACRLYMLYGTQARSTLTGVGLRWQGDAWCLVLGAPPHGCSSAAGINALLGASLWMSRWRPLMSTCPVDHVLF